MSRDAAPPEPPAELPAELRGYQKVAVDAACVQVGDHDAAQVHMACGTGKTLVALRIAEQATPGPGVVVVAVPTVALVDQILRSWRRDAAAAFTALAVCGDETVIDAPVHLDEIAAAVTTDPAEVTRWLGATPGRRVVFTTYVSAAVVADALRSAGRLADLLVCDEAHHLTGRSDTPTRQILDRAAFPAHRRLFLTATPRFEHRRNATGVPAVGMDDDAVFGPVAASYRFSEAIRDGWLADYRLAVIGVTSAEARALLAADDVEHVDRPGGEPLRELATHVAVARAYELYGARRVITFHRLVAGAARFARSLQHTLRRAGHEHAADTVVARHIHGDMSILQRGDVLDALREPPREGWTVISNARCLAEGIDIPAVDAVVFADPKRSPVDIVQAVGRAIRRPVEGGDAVATIVVPLIVDAEPGARPDGPDDAEAAAEPAIDPGEYDVLWQVVRALRAHDEELGIALDTQREYLGRDEPVELPRKVSVVLPPGTADAVLSGLTLRLIEHSTASWWEWLGRARRYRDQYGDLRVPVGYITDGGHQLGQWLRTQRAAAERGRLSEARRADLDELGMVWGDRFDIAWDTMATAAQTYHAEHGHLRVPVEHVTAAGERLGQWMSIQRQRHTAGRLRADRAERLAGLDATFSRGRDRFAEGLAAADRYLAEHGHLDVRQSYTDQHGHHLGGWIAHQRDRATGRRRPPLTSGQRAALDERGMIWRKRGDARDLTDDEATELQAARARGRRDPSVRQTLLRLHDDGVGQQQLADVLQITPSTVSTRIARARRERSTGPREHLPPPR